ncbi:ABC transporter ATP-binding protein [Hyphococcus luteus]|uniref:ABC transporter ATP-binding protein n=1 Tax=Hyphococcus luteus TaxID=2058213 RepID=UPI0010573931|nr:ABC transporter ATP-binding protein [Marinicaulis flavus]
MADPSPDSSSLDPHVSTRILAGRLWRGYLARYWPGLALALAAMAVYSGAQAGFAFSVEWIFGGLSGEEGAPSLGAVARFAPVIIIGLAVVYSASLYVSTRLTARAALSALRDMQNDMFDKMTALDFAQLRGQVAGQYMARFTNDVTVLRETLTRAAKGVRDAVTFAGLCAVMIYYDAVLFAAVIVIYALVGVFVARIGKLLRSASRKAQEQAGDLTALIGESVSGARMVKTYQIEPLERARASAAFDERLSVLLKMAYTRALNEPVIFVAGAAAIAVIIAVVAARIGAGATSFSEFAGFLTALVMLSQPGRGLGTLNAVVQEGFGAFERILSLIDAEPAVKTAPDAFDLPPGPGAIRFENVSFAYADGSKAVAGVTLDIPAGKMVALVGASGAGKSTLMNLLPRLYEPGEGRILIDGEDIAEVTLRSLRARMALVSQEAVLFNMSALENIAFGNPAASRADIIRAAENAAANDFIAQLPNAYDTPLGEGGANLSGGQRQRVALARAFLKDAPILLLDEATSALDAESEAKIQDALKRLTQGRTTLVIAHRLSTVKDADMIVVMDKGRIVETGTHDELVERQGAYARQAALQLV